MKGNNRADDQTYSQKPKDSVEGQLIAPFCINEDRDEAEQEYLEIRRQVPSPSHAVLLRSE